MANSSTDFTINTGPLAYQGPRLPPHFFHPGFNTARNLGDPSQARGFQATGGPVQNYMHMRPPNYNINIHSSSGLRARTIPFPGTQVAPRQIPATAPLSTPRSLLSTTALAPPPSSGHDYYGRLSASHHYYPSPNAPPGGRDSFQGMTSSVGFHPQAFLASPIGTAQQHTRYPAANPFNLFMPATNGVSFSQALSPANSWNTVSPHFHGIPSWSTSLAAPPHKPPLPAVVQPFRPLNMDSRFLETSSSHAPRYAEDRQHHLQAKAKHYTEYTGTQTGHTYEGIGGMDSPITHSHHNYGSHLPPHECSGQGETERQHITTSDRAQVSGPTSPKINLVELHEVTDGDINQREETRSDKPDGKQKRLRPAKCKPMFTQWSNIFTPLPHPRSGQSTKEEAQIGAECSLPPQPRLTELSDDHQQLQSPTSVKQGKRPADALEPISQSCPAPNKARKRRKLEEEPASNIGSSTSPSEQRSIKPRRTRAEMAELRKERGEKAMTTHVDDTHGGLTFHINNFE